MACQTCGAESFFHNGEGLLTCSTCFTVSQNDTQEEFDFEDAVGLAARGRAKKIGSKGKVGREGQPARAYDRSKRLPGVESCCLAFQWLLWDAAKHVSKLSGLHEVSTPVEEFTSHYGNDVENEPNLLELTVKKIWFTYLKNWTEATRLYSSKHPELRVSFRDLFLEDIRKSHLMREISVAVGKQVEEEMIAKLQHQSGTSTAASCTTDDSDYKSMSSMESDGDSASSQRKRKRGRKRKRRPYFTLAQLCRYGLPRKYNRHPNGVYDIHYQHAAMKIRPSLTLLLAILQLALTHLQSGIAPYQITSWVSNGLLPHALNGYELLPLGIKEDIQTIKNFFSRSFVPPAKVVADMVDMLATACNWFDDGLAIGRGKPGLNWRSFSNIGGGSSRIGKLDSTHPVHCHTYYNIPLLAARMVEVLGLQQQVLDNALSLMGVRGAAKADIKEEGGSNNDEVSESQKFVMPALKCAAHGNLYTPLDVASVIIVACKCCPGWENWRISTYSCEEVTDSDELTSFVPWNEQQLCLLKSGQLDHYLNFLQSSGFMRDDQKCKMSQYLVSLDKNLSDPDMDFSDPDTDTVVLNSSDVTSAVEGNRVLSGALNPNEELDVNSKNDNHGQFIYKRYQQSRKVGLIKKPPDANYARLIEFICFVIQEPRPIELHKSVERIEDELVSFFPTKPNREKTEG